MTAILAGWVIALMVWLLPAAETARVGAITRITYRVGPGGFSHTIAGSTLVFSALAVNTSTPVTALGSFFIPTRLGNIIGGVALLAAFNCAQVSLDG